MRIVASSSGLVRGQVVHASKSRAMISSLILEIAAIKEDVSVKAVARYFAGSHYKISEKTRERILHGIAAASDFTAPQAVYQLFAVSRTIPGEGVQLENGLHLKLPLCCMDSQIQLVAAAVGTLGDGLEKHCRKLAQNGQIYESTLFDAVGTAMLDLLSEKICDMVERVCGVDGLTIGKRFAPGINGYPLEQQYLLFKLVDHKSIGVFLNASAIMAPAKSISFFLMITDDACDVKAEHKCMECKMFHCQFRTNSLQQSMTC